VKLSGSGFARAEACPASTFLPGVIEPPSVYAKAGVVVHRYLCLVAEVGVEQALELIDEEWREVCRLLEVEGLPHATPDAWAFEVAYAWDFVADTARELYRGSGARQYEGLGASEIPGTADLVGMLDASTVIVLDLKTGWKPLGSPVESTQLGFYAVAAARATGATRALVGFVRLIDGEPRYIYGTLDEFALEAMAERLKAIVAAASFAEFDYQATGDVQVVAGDHCQHCPAFLRCPAKVTLAREFALAAGATEPALIPPVLDAESVPAALERLWQVQEVCKRVEKALQEFAETRPVRLPDGSIYGAVEASEETLDPDVAAPIIAERFGDAVAGECVEVKKTLTKAALKRVLQPIAKERGDKWAPTERDVLDAIRAAGGSKTSKWTVVKAFKPKLLK